MHHYHGTVIYHCWTVIYHCSHSDISLWWSQWCNQCDNLVKMWLRTWSWIPKLSFLGPKSEKHISERDWASSRTNYDLDLRSANFHEPKITSQTESSELQASPALLLHQPILAKTRVPTPPAIHPLVFGEGGLSSWPFRISSNPPARPFLLPGRREGCKELIGKVSSSRETMSF